MASGGSPPAQPDPVLTAQAQGQANIDAAKATAALNRYDTKNPFGTTAWSQDATNPDKWTNTTTLDPKVQAMLDNYYSMASQPETNINFGALPGAPTAVKPTALDISGAPQVGAARADVGQDLSAKVASQYGNLSSAQADRLKKLYATEFNYDSLGDMPTASDATRKAVEDSYYGRQTARLDPRFSQEEQQLRANLANQGVTEGSEAFAKAMQNFSMGKNDAYSSAMNDATTNSTSEMAKQFALQMAARQQGASELEKVRALPTTEAQAALGMYGQASGINQSNLLTQDKLYQTALNESQAAHDRYVSEANLKHSTDMTDQNQAFNQGTAARTAALNEQLAWQNNKNTSRTSALNELMALRTGAQASGGAGASQVQVGASPVAQSIYNNYQGQQQNYQANVASANSTNSTIGTIGAAALTAFAAY